MLGSMLVVTVAALLKAPVGFSLPLRMCMAIVLGTFLGSAFSPEIVDRLSDWLGGVAVMFVFVSVATAISVFFFIRYGRPAGTEGLSEDALADLVSRDAMIGVAEVAAP